MNDVVLLKFPPPEYSAPQISSGFIDATSYSSISITFLCSLISFIDDEA
jgi:hypothetical protein